MPPTNLRRDARGRLLPKEKAPTSTGFGESKTFNAPEGTFPDDPVRESFTLGGEPLTVAQAALIPFAMTDQGRAEKAQQVEANGGYAQVEFLREKVELPGGIAPDGTHVPSMTLDLQADEEGKGLQKFADLLKDGIQPWDVEGGDVFGEAKRLYERPGYRIRALSKRTIDTRGMRGWSPVRDKNGKVAMVGNMIVGEMPLERVKQRDAYMKKQSHDQMVSANDKVREQVGQIASASKLDRVARKKGQELDRGMTSFRGDAAEMSDSDFAQDINLAPVNY